MQSWIGLQYGLVEPHTNSDFDKNTKSKLEFRQFVDWDIKSMPLDPQDLEVCSYILVSTHAGRSCFTCAR